MGKSKNKPMSMSNIPMSLLPLKETWNDLKVRDPTSFIASMYDVDPEELKRMDRLADELIAAGVAEERRLSDAREHSNELYTNQTLVVEDCRQNLEGATSILEEYKTKLEREASIEATNRRNMYEGEQDTFQKKLKLDKVIEKNDRNQLFLEDENNGYIELRKHLVEMKNAEDETKEKENNAEEVKSDIAISQLAFLDTRAI